MLTIGMHYVGVDIIGVVRIAKAVACWGERFLRRMYTDSELELCCNRPVSLAGRFAGKEAVMKLLGTGRRGVSWREIEILSHSSGKPLVNLYGRAQNKARKLGIKEIAVSLSHSREYAIVSVASTSEENCR